MKVLLIILLGLSLNLNAGWRDPKHEILITVPKGVKGNLVAEWGDTPWDTIERYFDEQHYQYKNTDEIHFRVTPKKGEVYYLYGCVIGGELIITAADPLWCPE